MKKDNIWLLIAKMLTGDASHEELAEINRASMADPELDVTIKILHRMWNGAPNKKNEKHFTNKLLKCFVPPRRRW